MRNAGLSRRGFTNVKGTPKQVVHADRKLV
jgi:hypothetical protein